MDHPADGTVHRSSLFFLVNGIRMFMFRSVL